MYVKLKIEGELLELLKQESELECRTPTQQSLYIIKSYYKNKVVTDSSKTEIEVTEDKAEVTEVTEIEQDVTVADIPEDIFNF